MTGPGFDRPKSVVVNESISGPINHRDASNNSGHRWTKPPTVIPVPAVGERPQRAPLRPHDNPWGFTNTLVPKTRRPGNPNVRQTVLAKIPDGFTSESHVRKRQKLDVNISSGLTLNGASSSYTRRPAPRSNFSEPDVQVIEPFHVASNHSNPVPNDAEVIDIRTSSDDLGERVSRATKSSSPCPMLLYSGQVTHAFDTLPTEYSLSSSNKGKGRAKELPEYVVEDSEASDNIEEFTSPALTGRPSSSKKSPGIPKYIVRDRKRFYEGTSAPAPAAVRHTVQNTPPVDLIRGTVVSHMKKKDEGAFCSRSSTNVYDRVGTSSSNFLNIPREKEKIQVLPLEAWCLGHHHFRHSESAPLKLSYESAQQRVKVTWGQSLLERVEFQLDRDVRSATIVNDGEEALKENVVVQFITARGQKWKEVDRRYKGFEEGDERGKNALTFLFSAAKDRGFTATNYQTFVTGTKKALKASTIEVIGPSKGRNIWDYAIRLADMFEQTESRKGKKDHSESTTNHPSDARSLTPCSSTSAKTRTSCPESKPSNRDSGPFVPHRRSARQSAIRSSGISSPPPPPALLEPDEVILMYPPTGTGALSIMTSDLRRLQPEEYLNDTLIEFGLKLWLNDLREKSPALADQIHVFSSFFYKKLNNRKNPEDGYKSVRKWTSKVDLFEKKYIIVPINENIHWYLAVIYEPGHTLKPPLPISHSPNVRATRKRKQTQERAETKPGATVVSEPAPTELSLQQLHFSAQGPEGGPEADTSSMDATRATTPSTNEEMITDKSSSIMIGSEPVSDSSSEIQARDPSPSLVYPPSDNMDVDADISIPDVIPNPVYEIAEVPDPSTSKPSSGIPASQFYGSGSKLGEGRPVVIVDNEDSSEDQQQEAEVDDMLAVTQSSTGHWPAQTYIFTLDSLGTRHPQAIKVLKQYLVREAKDKRNFDEVRDAIGRQVQVPVQPNSWDCGIYLLHFVKVFMSASTEFLEQILSTRGIMLSSERKKMWQDHDIPQFRDHLKSRIIQLSEEWKVEKTVREEEASRRRSRDVVEVEALSSEGEVDIVEDIPLTSVKSTPGLRQKRPAMRLRG